MLALQDKLPSPCYVNPGSPSQAVLVRTLPWHAFRFSGLAFAAAGAALLAWTRRVARGKPPAWMVRVPTLVCWIAAGLLVYWALALLTYRHGYRPVRIPFVIFLGLIVLGLLVPRSATLNAAAALVVASAVLLPCGGLFLMNDSSTDDLHDPLWALEYGLYWFSATQAFLTVSLMARLRADQHAHLRRLDRT